MWPDWPPRWIVLWYNQAARAIWREHAFQQAIRGIEPGDEPEWDFGLDDEPEITDHDEAQYRAWKERRMTIGVQ